jgi:hypothetical protein
MSYIVKFVMIRSLFKPFRTLWSRVRGGDAQQTHIHKTLYPASGKIPAQEITDPVRKRARRAPPPKKIRGGRATWYPLNGGARKIPWGTSARASSQL